MATSPSNMYDEGREQHTFNKIRQLNDRWKEIDFEIDREKQSRKENLEDQIVELEQILNRQKADHESKLSQMKQHVQAAAEVLISEKSNRRSFSDIKDRELREMEQAIVRSIDDHQKAREEVEVDWLRQADQRILGIMGDSTQLSGDTTNNLDNALATARTKLTELENSILHERKRIHDQSSKVAEAIEIEVNRLHNGLDNQRKVREATQKKLFKLIEDIQHKLECELSAEKRQRQETNDALLRLLEETCNRVDRSFR